MLNKKQNRAVSFLLVFFFSVLFASARISPTTINITDSSKGSSSDNTSLMSPEFPLHPSMENFVADYADDYEALFEKMKVNKSGFFKTIDKVFTQQDIPVELKYLAVVESQLKTNARSGVGAVGLWQFMPATAKRFGLKVTPKYDERQHVWKSSVAAAKYLNELYDIFEDWLLVIASYNSGPGHVLNAIKKSGSRNFWKLQYFLPKETRNHVKRFIATHYYFEGSGSLVTLGKAESEKYLKELEKFTANNNNEEDDTTDPIVHVSQWIAVINNQKDLNFVLKK